MDPTVLVAPAVFLGIAGALASLYMSRVLYRAAP